MSGGKGKSKLPLLLIGCGVAAIGSGSVLFMRSIFTDSAPPPKKLVQEIRIIRPPPPEELPPPPPPPPEEEVDLSEPEAQPDPVASNEPPPGDLGLDAEGTAGGDAFGLLGRKGGRDLLGSGGSALAWYSAQLKGDILECLQDSKEASSGKFTAGVQLWIRADGSVERAKLIQSSGDAVRDRALETHFVQQCRSQGPPAGAPQPISVRFKRV